MHVTLHIDSMNINMSQDFFALCIVLIVLKIAVVGIGKLI